MVCKSEIERGKEESERSREEKVVSTKLSQRTEAKNVLNCCFFFSFSFLLFFSLFAFDVRRCFVRETGCQVVGCC